MNIAKLLAAFAVMSMVMVAQSPPMTLLRLADNVYAMQHPAGAANSIFAVTGEGVVVWDADIRSADLVLAAVRRTTDKKVRYLIISHPAGDHATGGWTYREDRPVMVASRKQARALAAEELEEFRQRTVSAEPRFANYHGAQLVQPDLIFEGSLTLRFGGLTFELTEEGAAHSVSDVTMYIPEKKVFGLGDLFRTESHNGPVTAGLIEQIRARRLAVDTMVPGHGPIHAGRGQADLDEAHLYFTAMRGQVASLLAQGKTEAQAVAEFKVPSPFEKYAAAETLNRLVPAYYRSLKDEAPRP